MLALALSAFAAHNRVAPPGAQRGGRLAPPPGLACPVNSLTVYEGRVTAYRRRAASTYLRVRTDFDTTEHVTIRHRREGSPARWFLLEAEPFKAEDWARVESRRGRLRPNMRAHVWVCENGSMNPVVDWRPPAP